MSRKNFLGYVDTKHKNLIYKAAKKSGFDIRITIHDNMPNKFAIYTKNFTEKDHRSFWNEFWNEFRKLKKK